MERTIPELLKVAPKKLTANNMCKGSFEKGHRRCLEGWLMRLLNIDFKNLSHRQLDHITKFDSTYLTLWTIMVDIIDEKYSYAQGKTLHECNDELTCKENAKIYNEFIRRLKKQYT